MDEVLSFFGGALQITLLDLTLCGDNIGVIALATRNLPSQFARKAGLIGIGGAISLRILFASMMTLLFSIESVPIKLLGGLLLVKITWDFVKPKEEEEAKSSKAANKFWEAVLIIIIADISMSLDNVLAIAGAANGHVWLIVFGIALNIPILFFGSQFVVNLMRKYEIVIYIGGAILAHTAFKMIFEDGLIEPYLQRWFTIAFPWFMGLVTLGYGAYLVYWRQKAAGEEPQEAGARYSVIEQIPAETAASEIDTKSLDR